MASEAAMILRGPLPSELSVGRVSLRPLNAQCWRLTQCDGCAGFSADCLVGACGHAFCATPCASLPASNDSDQHATQATLWCDLCQRASDGPADRRQVARQDLDGMRFACPCGAFEGGLAEIKKHLAETLLAGDPHRHRLTDATTTMDKQDKAEGKAEEPTGGDGSKNNNDDQLDAFTSRVETLGGELRESRETVAQMAERAGSLQECVGGSRDAGHSVLWIPVKKLVAQFHAEGGQSAKVFSPLYKWTAHGFHCGTQFVVADRGGTVYLGASHRATHPLTAEARAAWKPFKVIIGTRVLDKDGDSVETGITPTWKEGEFVSDAFDEPLGDHVSGGFGPSNLISVEKLMDPDQGIVNANGFARFVVEIAISPPEEPAAGQDSTKPSRPGDNNRKGFLGLWRMPN